MLSPFLNKSTWLELQLPKQVTAMVSPVQSTSHLYCVLYYITLLYCTVYCITLHYGRSNGGNAGNVKISSSMLSPDIFTADTQHSSLCSISPTILHRLHSTKLTHSLLAVTADVGKTLSLFLQWWAHKPRNYRV